MEMAAITSNGWIHEANPSYALLRWQLPTSLLTAKAVAHTAPVIANKSKRFDEQTL